MKNLVIVSLFVIIGCKSMQSVQENPIIDENANLVNTFEKSDLLKEPFVSWYSVNYDEYTPDPEIIAQIKPLWKGVTIKAFMGSWCRDSKREVPRFYKVLEQSGFKMKNLTFVGVNRQMKSPENQQEGLNIQRVPTFIFYKNGKEIGRYVEYPVDFLEKDILKILQEKGYVNPFEV